MTLAILKTQESKENSRHSTQEKRVFGTLHLPCPQEMSFMVTGTNTLIMIAMIQNLAERFKDSMVFSKNLGVRSLQRTFLRDNCKNIKVIGRYQVKGTKTIP